MHFDPDKQLARAYLRQHESLGPLAERAASLIEIRRVYRDNIPAGLSHSSEVANFRQGIVVVGAENSATAAKIKQLVPRLAALFLEKGWQVSAIQVRVQGRGDR